MNKAILNSGGLPDSSVGKESTCNAGDPGLNPGSGRSAGERIGYPLQYSRASLVAQLVKNPYAGDLGSIPGLGRSPWTRKQLPRPVFWPQDYTVHGVSKSWTRLRDFHFSLFILNSSTFKHTPFRNCQIKQNVNVLLNHFGEREKL